MSTESDKIVADVQALAARIRAYQAPLTPPPGSDPGPGPVTLDDTDPAVVYGGTWLTSSGNGKYGGTDHYTGVAASTVTISFTGTRIQLIGIGDAHHGTAAVRVDAGPSVTVNQQTSVRANGMQFYDSGPLAGGAHTLVLSVTGNGVIALDRVSLNGAPSSPPPINDPLPPTTGGKITVAGNKILRDGQEWWFLGYNSFVWSGNCGHSQERMTAAQVDAWFSSMRHDGHGCVRLFFYRGWDYGRLDAAIAAARQHNIYLLITLDDALGGCGENNKTDGWFTNQAERDDFKDHLRAVLSRYRGETRIFAVEYFNEPSYRGGALRRFYDEMGAVARSVDPDRLMCSGTVAPYWLGGNANYRDVHQSPGVDIASLHEYDQQEIISNHLDDCIANAAGKPVIVGEFGINANASGSGCETNFTVRASRFQLKADAYIREPGCVGALAWAWQPGSNGGCGYGTLDLDTASQTVLRTTTR